MIFNPIGRFNGIYSIRNCWNNKVYVGSAIDIKKRWRQHRSEFYHGRAVNSHLLRAFTKYELKSFIFSILELCDPKDFPERECYWIETFDTTNKEKGYNVNIPTREFLDSYKRNYRKSDRTCNNIVCIDTITGEIEIGTRREFKKRCGVSGKFLGRCLQYWTNYTKNTQKSCYGKIYITESVYDPSFDYIGFSRRPPIKIREKKFDKRITVVALNTITKEELTFCSALECAKQFNVTRDTVRHALKSTKLINGYSLRKKNSFIEKEVLELF